MAERIIRLGASAVDEERLLQKLDALKKDVVEYAVKYESWFDCAFKIPFEHQNDRPREGQVLTLVSDNSVLFPLIDGLANQPNSSEEFMRLVENHGLEYEKDIHGSMIGSFGVCGMARRDILIGLTRSNLIGIRYLLAC